MSNGQKYEFLDSDCIRRYRVNYSTRMEDCIVVSIEHMNGRWFMHDNFRYIIDDQNGNVLVIDDVVSIEINDFYICAMCGPRRQTKHYFRREDKCLTIIRHVEGDNTLDISTVYKQEFSTEEDVNACLNALSDLFIKTDEFGIVYDSRGNRWGNGDNDCIVIDPHRFDFKNGKFSMTIEMYLSKEQNVFKSLIQFTNIQHTQDVLYGKKEVFDFFLRDRKARVTFDLEHCTVEIIGFENTPICTLKLKHPSLYTALASVTDMYLMVENYRLSRWNEEVK